MSKRYNFDGFTFAGDHTQLEIVMLSENGFGYTSKFSIELTDRERRELIKFLKNIVKEEDN